MKNNTTKIRASHPTEIEGVDGVCIVRITSSYRCPFCGDGGVIFGNIIGCVITCSRCKRTLETVEGKK